MAQTVRLVGDCFLFVDLFSSKIDLDTCSIEVGSRRYYWREGGVCPLKKIIEMVREKGFAVVRAGYYCVPNGFCYSTFWVFYDKKTRIERERENTWVIWVNNRPVARLRHGDVETPDVIEVLDDYFIDVS